MSNIYPEEFFNISHPTTPNVQIQFRTSPDPPGFEDGLSHPKFWENITFVPNNFFNELSIEDEGGAKKLSLTLVDKNHSFLEDKIIRMMQAIKISDLKARTKFEQHGDGFIKSYTSPQAAIRIRIGYSGTDREGINESSFSSYDFENRLNQRIPVVQSPWMYFLITGMNISVVAEGLRVEIEGYNEMYPFIDSMRITTKRAKIVGEPKEIIEIFRQYLSDVLSDFDIEIKDDPLPYINEQGNTKLEVPLIQIESNEPQFKSIREIINDFCSKVPPIIFNKSGNVVSPKSYDEASDASQEEHVSYNYSWMVEDNGTKGKKMIFYYRTPNKSQSLVRTYTWIEHAQSIVRELSLNSDHLFSQLTLPIVMIDDEGRHAMYSIQEREENGRTFYSSENMTDMLNDETFEFSFAKKIYDLDDFKDSRDSITSPSGKVILSASARLDEILHQGSITLQGDPFYFFTKDLIPFMYKINIIVKKPTYVDERGERVGGGKSYLSGAYVIKKINHSISGGDYTTQLEIQRALNDG